MGCGANEIFPSPVPGRGLELERPSSGAVPKALAAAAVAAAGDAAGAGPAAPAPAALPGRPLELPAKSSSSPRDRARAGPRPGAPLNPCAAAEGAVAGRCDGVAGMTAAARRYESRSSLAACAGVGSLIRASGAGPCSGSSQHEPPSLSSLSLLTSPMGTLTNWGQAQTVCGLGGSSLSMNPAMSLLPLLLLRATLLAKSPLTKPVISVKLCRPLAEPDDEASGRNMCRRLWPRRSTLLCRAPGAADA